MLPASYRPHRALLTLDQGASRTKMHVLGGSGSGKSWFLGRRIAYSDLLGEIPLIVFDMHGRTINHLLDELAYLDAGVQKLLSPRIRLFQMSGRDGYVGRFPIYYRRNGDSLYHVGARLPRLLIKLDPDQARAPRLGASAIDTIGTNAGMVLSALNLTIADVPKLLGNTTAWEDRLRKLGQENSEAKPAVNYFLDLYLRSAEERRRSDAFITKINPLTNDQINRTMFCTSERSVDWQEVIDKKQAVLFDFEGDPGARFKVLWVLTDLLEFIRARGEGEPVSIIVDELAFLLAEHSTGHDLLSSDFDELINKDARNNNLWLTLSHQEMHQLPKRIQQTLMDMGTQLIGVTRDQETAMQLANMFLEYRPYWVKKEVPVYDRGMVINHRTTEFSPQEQQIMASTLFRKLRPYHFLASIARYEGDAFAPLQSVNIMPDPDPEHRPVPRPRNPDLIERLRKYLTRREGIPTALAQATSQPLEEVVPPTVETPVRRGPLPRSVPKTRT